MDPEPGSTTGLGGSRARAISTLPLDEGEPEYRAVGRGVPSERWTSGGAP